MRIPGMNYAKITFLGVKKKNPCLHAKIVFIHTITIVISGIMSKWLFDKPIAKRGLKASSIC
jgi:hypothetical protein